MGPTHCNFRKHWTCETHWKTARKALDAFGSWILCGRFVFHCLCSLWKHSAVPAIICSSLHITSYCCYSYVSCILCSLLVSSEVAASRGHVVVFALPFISYLYHWFLFALLCLHCGERAKVQMIVHMKMCTALACVSLPALVHLGKPTYPPDTCWQTAHITVWYSVHAGNDSILQYDWGLIFIPSCR